MDSSEQRQCADGLTVVFIISTATAILSAERSRARKRSLEPRINRLSINFRSKI
jgi:hypothetical protein